jgi:hypothetical protein
MNEINRIVLILMVLFLIYINYDNILFILASYSIGWCVRDMRSA